MRLFVLAIVLLAAAGSVRGQDAASTPFQVRTPGVSEETPTPSAKPKPSPTATAKPSLTATTKPSPSITIKPLASATPEPIETATPSPAPTETETLTLMPSPAIETATPLIIAS